MRTAIKNTTALLFTMLGAAPLLLVIFTGIKRQEIRCNMKQQLETRMLHTITLAEKDVHWLHEGKEILINGRLFDIKNFRFSDNGKISFTGLYDEEETALLHKVKTNQQNENNAGGKLLARFFQLAEASLGNPLSDIIIPADNNIHFPCPDQQLASPFRPILYPPPQV